jgi:hypothetical protein
MSASNTCLFLNACTHLATFNMVRHNHPMLHLALHDIPMNFCHVKLLFTCTQAISLYGLSFLNKGANTITFAQHIHMHTCTYTPPVGNIYQYKEWSFKCIFSISKNATFLGKKIICLTLHSESHIISTNRKANEKKKEHYMLKYRGERSMYFNPASQHVVR